MKIKIIDPIVRSNKNNGLLNREASISYLKKFLQADTEIDFDNIEYGFESVESVLNLSFNAPEVVLKAKQAQEAGYDGIFVNCFDDPGAYGAREIIDIPIYGGYVPSIMTAASLGGNICIITTGDSGIYTEAKKVKDSGYEGIVKSIRSVELQVLELGRKDALLCKLLDICVDSIKNEGINVFVFGCTGMNYIAEELRERLKAGKYSAVIIEPMATGVRYLEYIIRLGYTNSLSNNTCIGSLKWQFAR